MALTQAERKADVRRRLLGAGARPKTAAERKYVRETRSQKGSTAAQRKAVVEDILKRERYSDVEVSTAGLTPAAKSYVESVNVELEGKVLTGAELSAKEREVETRLTKSISEMFLSLPAFSFKSSNSFES